MILIQCKLFFAHFSSGFVMFLWENEIISTTNNRYFQLKCNLFWRNCEIFWHTNIEEAANMV